MNIQELRSKIGSPEKLTISNIESLFKGHSLLGYAYLSLFSTDYLILYKAIEAFKSAGHRLPGLAACMEIAQNYNFPTFYYKALKALGWDSWGSFDKWFSSVGHEKFEPPEDNVCYQPELPNLHEWCEKEGIQFVSQLQKRSRGMDRKSEVILIRDKDGKYKILKEIVNYRLGPFQDFLNEDETLKRLPHLPFIPRFYGRVDISGIPFLRRSYMYGHPLSRFVNFNKGDVEVLLHRLALNLDTLLGTSRLLFLDVSPSNIIVQHEDGPGFLDLGLSRFLEQGKKEIPVLMSQPRYTAPETGMYMNASEKSVVYQLGLLGYRLLTGNHPFDLFPGPRVYGRSQSKIVNESLRCLWPIMALSDLSVGDECGIIKDMLSPCPEKRPSFKDCARGFESKAFFPNNPIKMDVHFPVPDPKKNCILFPARMGIPHRGHIQYMSHLLNFGYKLIISIQRSYTITERDPIPKWLVMKMVAQSLMDQGYSTDCFKIFLTPFYETDKEMATHFDMLPGREDIVAIASSNPEVHSFFPDLPCIEQADVLGHEGGEFTVRSWGETLRNSVVKGEKENYDIFAATGVEKILSFEELRAMYMQSPVTVPVKSVTAYLGVSEKDRYFSGVERYSNPEETLVKGLVSMGLSCELLDLYSKNSRVLFKGQERFFVYEKTEPNDGNVKIYFKMI
jgi:serine/threonine protein kinase